MAHYHVLIFAGQSNQGGYGSIAGLPLASSDAPYTSYAQPTAGTLPGLFYQTNTTASLTAFKTHILQDASTYGPELACCRKYKDTYPERNLCVLKVTFGGSSAKDWFGTGAGEGWGWATLSQVIQQAKDLLDAAEHEYTWDALVWLQGETGAQDVYKQTIDTSLGDAAFIPPTLYGFEQIRTATSSSLKIVVGRIGDHMATQAYLDAQNAADPTYTQAQYLAALQYRWAQQASVVAQTPNSVLVNMDGIGNRTAPPDADAIHWPDAGYLAAGERFFTQGYAMLSAPRARLRRIPGLRRLRGVA